MKKIATHLMILFLLLATSNLAACNKKEIQTSSDVKFGQGIKEKLNRIVNPKDKTISLSSNPYDYIKAGDGKLEYESIVAEGKKALNYMLEDFKSNNDNGLREYIMAIACSDILNEDPSIKKWSSGRGWFNSYLMKDN